MVPYRSLPSWKNKNLNWYNLVFPLYPSVGAAIRRWLLGMVEIRFIRFTNPLPPHRRTKQKKIVSFWGTASHLIKILLSLSNIDQKKLVDRVKANDPVVLKALYHANYYKVEQYIVNNSGSKEQAKDIYQEAFLTLWKNVKLGKFIPNEETALNGYLYRIAQHKWLDYLKSAHRRKQTSLQEHEHYLREQDGTSALEIEDFNSERLAKIVNTFELLGEPCRNLLITFYFEKKPLREIAKALQIGEASARNKKYRCIEKLRTLIHNPNQNF